MKTQTITSKRERIAVWQATHKQLLHDDPEYRKRHTTFLISIVFLSCAMLPFYLPFFGIPLFGFAVDVSIISSLAITIVFLSWWQFQFQNQRIQSYLQSSHDA
jgi:asparagine N-glycosylation enzyme membrane subunit Stt3